MKKRMLAILMALALIVSLLPAGVLAVDGEEGDQTFSNGADEGVVINKKLTGNAANGYKISLEAYVTGEITSTSKSVPLDIVLVLDQSGSVARSGYLSDLKEAVTGFVNSVREDAEENKVEHRVALVGSASDADDGTSDGYVNDVSSGSSESYYVNTGLFIDGYLKNYETKDEYKKVYSSELETSETYYIYIGYGYYQQVKFSAEESSWGYEGYTRWNNVTPKTSDDDRRNTQFYELVEGSGALTASDYRSALVSVNDDSVDTAIGNIASSGATRTSLGMEMAANVLSNNEKHEDSQQVVIVFTDGEPGQSGFENSEANGAIGEAKDIKGAGAKVYTIGLYNNPDHDVENFMNYLSSNYPNAQGMNNHGQRGEGDYYYTVSNSSGLSGIFDTIFDEVISGTVDADESSILTDTLTEFVTFGDLGENAGAYENVEVEVDKATGSESKPSWKNDSSFDTSGIKVTVDGKNISVTGFNYSGDENVVLQKDGEWQGRRLVITFPIEVDKNCTAWDGRANGKYPTNVVTGTPAGVIANDVYIGKVNKSPTITVQTYKVDYEFVSGTAGKELPEGVTSQLQTPDQEYFLSGTEPTNGLVGVTYNPVDDGTGTWTPADEWTEAKDASGNVTYTLTWTYENNYTPGSPITVKVVVDGKDVTNDNTYIDVTAWDDRTESFNATTSEENGDFSISFEYDKFNAADFQITNKSDLILQAISANLIYGESGSNGINNLSGSNTYTLDNVAGNSTVTVYLYTPYTVKYYVNDVESETITDSATYIVDSQTASGTAPGTSGDVETLVTATFANNASSIELKDLPTETGKTYSGWFLGSSTGQQQVSPVDVETASTSATDEDVIEFYATSTDNDYTVRYNPNLPDGATGIETPNTTTHNYNDTVTLDETITSSTTVKVGHDTYTFSGWTTAKTESGTSVSISNNTITMPAENVIVSGAWTKTSSDPTFDVTYKWENNVAPSDASLPEGETGKYEGDEITVANGYDPITGTNSDGVPGTWTFDGWTSTNVDVSSGTFTMPAENVIITGSWKFTPKSYNITVEVENGTSDPAGTTISVQHGENQTIKFTANDGYALDYVTVDGEADNLTDGKYTFESITADHSIVVVFAIDSNEDDIPDYKQVIVYFEADDNGSVDGELTQAFTATEGEETVTFTPNNVTPNANTGYAFDIWTKDGGEEGVNPFTTTTAEAGTTITYTAHFAKDEIGDEGGGDDIPDKYQATIVYNVVHGTWDGETDAPITYIVDTATYNKTTGKWDPTNATLEADGRPIPTDMKPDADYIAPGTWDETPDGTLVLAGEETYEYTHTFSTLVDDSYSVTKTAKVDGIPLDKDDYVQVGDTITYTITVKNTGNVTLSNITLTDTFTGSGTLNFGSMPDGVTVKDGKITITSIAVGGKVEITATYEVVDGDKTLTNTVTYGEDETTTVTTDVADLEVIKTASAESVNVGDTINYTITVENTGNVALTNVVVTDSLWEDGTVIYVNGVREVLTGDSYTIESISAGLMANITYEYVVTRADEHAGEIENEVTVKAGNGTTDSDTEKTPVDDGWTPKPDDDDDTVYVPNWLNTTDHYAYIVGYEDGTIRPQNNITRAEVATIFFRLLTDNARERYWSTTNDFSDIAAESWYNNAISTLSNMGIINGYEDGTFKPNAPITRAEFTAIATRFFDYEAEYDGAFNDVSARAWYADYVQAAVDMGLVDGYPDGGFHPDAYITRAEACTIVNRVLHRVPHEDHLLSESVMNTWPDNPKSAWYYEDMQEATNSHDYDWIRDDGETVEDWTKKLPERDWSALETEWATAYSR